MNPFAPAPKKQKVVVRYVKEKPQTRPKIKISSNSALERPPLRSDPLLKLDAKVVAGSKIPPPYIEREQIFKNKQDIFLNKSPQLSRPNLTASSPIAIKKKISLPPIDMAKINNPNYITYYQIVREKIRRSAFQNFTHNETGEVYVSFIISNDGLIRNTRLVEEKTTANDYLKDIALKSVREASPFPNFPKELDYQQLSFNIIISFQIE